MKRFLRKGFDRLAAAVHATVVLLALVMLATLSLQVLVRFFFGQALSWSEELALACFSWSMLLAIALGVRNHIHVRMDLLTEALPKSVQLGLEKLIGVAIAALGVYLAWAGTNYMQNAFGTTSAAIAYPTAYLYACAPVCGGLIVLFALEVVLIGPVILPLKPDLASENKVQ
jgi:TRAP-type C4-dicarboxylate transport system permease small subunit